jgi:hypothetical protein
MTIQLKQVLGMTALLLMLILVSDNQVTVACATLGKLGQISLFPLTKNIMNTSLDINAINLLNLILISPRTHV